MSQFLSVVCVCLSVQEADSLVSVTCCRKLTALLPSPYRQKEDIHCPSHSILNSHGHELSIYVCKDKKCGMFVQSSTYIYIFYFVLKGRKNNQ